MADIINVTEEIIDVNVTEEVITIAAGNGAYPLAYPVYTVFGRTGAVVATSGDYTTTQVTEGTNLYFTNTRARAAISLTTTGTSGAATYTSGVINIPQYQGVLTNPVTGTGTTNYLSKWTASGTIGNGNVFDNGNGVIIGGTTALIQAGTTYLSIQNNTLANSRGIAFYCNDGTQNPRTWIRHNTDSGNQYLAFDSTYSTANGFANFAFLNGGVLINTTTDAGYHLDVNGTSRFVGNSTFDASIGIGTTSLTNYGIRISKNLTGGTSGYGVSVDGTIQSDVTTARFFHSAPAIQATTYTLNSLQHFVAGGLTLGAGSSVTSQFGFLVLSNNIGATNNYAFSGQLASATNTWNLHMSGTAPNYMAGSLSIGTTTSTGYRLIVGGAITGSVTSYGVYSFGTIQSDVTSSAYLYRATPSTAAASFNVGNIYGYLSSAGSLGAGSSATNHYAFFADALSIGTNNYGFFGAVAAGTGRWNLYMSGTADNFLSGNTGIGGGANNITAGSILTSTLTDGGTGYVDGTYTDVAVTTISTGGLYALYTIVVASGIITTATLTWGGQNYKVGDTITVSNTLLGGTGSGLIITIASVDSSQLRVTSSATTGTDLSLYRSSTSLVVTNPYGSIKFEGNDASTKSSGVQAKIGAYAAGSSGGAYLSFFTSTGAGGALTEQLRIGNGGQVGIGGAYSLTGYSLRISKDITGAAITNGVQSDGVIQSGVTTQFVNFRSFPSTAVASFTLTDLIHFNANQSTIGAGSTVTTQYGFNVSSTLIGATTNYGFFGNIAAGTGRWNLFMSGTADNYLAGNTGIGNSANFTSAGVILTTTLTNGGSGYVDGTYTDVAATNIVSNGVYALFTIVVSAGMVTTATLTWGGTTYRAGDTLTVSNTLLGGTGSGLIITVNTVDSSVLTIASASGGDITLYRNDTSSAVGENIGTIKWESRDSSAKSSGIGAEIGAFSAGTVGGAYLSFFTRSSSAGTSLVEAMRIDSTGGVGIGATVLTQFGLKVAKNITGSVSSYGITSEGIIQSGVTSNSYYNYTSASTAASTFTLTNLYHYASTQGTFGAGSTVTNQFGFIAAASLIGATNNYGFYGAIASGTNRWNLYMAGTAQNYLAGNTGIGVAAKTTAELSLGAGTTAQAQINLASSTAPTSPQDGDIWFDGTNLKIRVGGVTKTVTIV